MEVRAHLHGPVAEVVVRQRFRNDRPVAVDPVYRFDRPDGGVVLDLRSKIDVSPGGSFPCGGVSLAGVDIVDPELGRELRQSLPRVPAGAVVEVELRYLERLAHAAGEVEFAVPIEGPAEVEVIAEARTPILAVESPNPEVHVKHVAGQVRAHLAVDGSRRHERFILHYRVDGPWPAGAALLGPRASDGWGNYVIVVGSPGELLQSEARELVFLIDGRDDTSMMGRTIAGVLMAAGPDDTVQVLRRAGDESALYDAPRPVSRETLRHAVEFVRRTHPPGVRGDIAAQLARPASPGRHRHVFILDDANRGAAVERFQPIVADLRVIDRRARVFYLAFGPARLTWPMRDLAYTGRTEAILVEKVGDVVTAVERIGRYLNPIVVRDLEIDWGGLKVDQDTTWSIHAYTPTVLRGRYWGDPRSSARIVGHGRDRDVDLELPIFDLGPLAESIFAERPVDACSRDYRYESRRRATEGAIYYVDCACFEPPQKRPPERAPTAVADFSAIAGEDARGPRIAGMPSAESELRVDGVPISGAIASQTPQETITTRRRAPRVADPVSRVRVETPRAGGAIASDDLHRAVAAQARVLAECFVAADRSTYRLRQRVTLRLRRAVDGRITEASVQASEVLALEIGACLRDVVAGALSGSGAIEVEVPMVVTMRF